jgi:hypothetical protein
MVGFPSVALFFHITPIPLFYGRINIPSSLRLNYESHSSFSSTFDHSYVRSHLYLCFVVHLLKLSLHIVFFLMTCCDFSYCDYYFEFLIVTFLYITCSYISDLPCPSGDTLTSIHILHISF